MAELIGMIVVGAVYIAILFAIDAGAALAIQWAIGELWHPVPFWPVFIIVAIVTAILGRSSE